MLKTPLTIFCAIVFVAEGTIIRSSPYISKDEFGLSVDPYLRSTDQIALQWGPHIMDFLTLIDLEKMATTAMQFMADPEVMNFIKFVISPEFKEIIWDFETMDEFKEAYVFLASKGYDMATVMIFINTALNLPPFEKPVYAFRNERGISGFFEAMINTLPMEDMKKLFESKLETSPEIGKLFETINSEEFIDIMKRMHQNPKFTEIKMIFESYGFDFKFLCSLAKEIFADYYQGIFCE